ncbi:MAG: hypothetical protein N3D15_09285 [Syntrophorhabdaceae bacterium]|nr:hypothetical protein [Syntrophorhabdaceae bacterium]
MYFITIQVVEIGEKERLIRVRNEDVIILQYTHSMYGVQVREKFIVNGNSFILYHVDTDNAALEYFGIEGKDKGNVRIHIKEFSIPKDSIGDHTLYIKNKALKIAQYNGRLGSINVKLRRIPIMIFLISCLWR